MDVKQWLLFYATLSLFILSTLADGTSVVVDIEESNVEKDSSPESETNVCTESICEADLVDKAPDNAEKSSFTVDSYLKNKDSNIELEKLLTIALDTLIGPQDLCLSFKSGNWWNYELCHKRNVTQYHEPAESKVEKKRNKKKRPIRGTSKHLKTPIQS